MTTQLFREAAVQAKRDSLYGNPLARFGLRAGVAALVTLTALAGALVFACTQKYTRKGHVMGVIVVSTGTIKIFTPKTGVVLQTLVPEGALVRRGDRLVELLVTATPEEGRVREYAIQKTTEQIAHYRRELGEITDLARVRERDLRDRIDAKRRTLLERSGQVQQAGELVAHARSVHARHAAHRGTFFSAAAVDEKSIAVTAAERDLSEARVQRDAVAAEIDSLTTEIDSVRASSEQEVAALRRGLAREEQALQDIELQRSVTITATADGVLDLLAVKTGQAATPGRALAVIVPQGVPYEAHLYAPPRAVGFIRIGQTVSLRYDAYPYQKFGSYEGVVTAVSEAPVKPDDDVASETLRDSSYRVSVALKSQTVNAYGRSQRLRPGATLTADIWLDRRTLLEWLFEPLFTISGRV